MDKEVTEQDRETIEALCIAIHTAIDEQTEVRRFTVGHAMEALFTVMAQAAKGSPEWDPKRFVAEVNLAANRAAGMQS